MSCVWKHLLYGCRYRTLLRSRHSGCKHKNLTTRSQIEPMYDVIVVGGGHAGTEAAASAARMGCNTLLVTRDVENVGELQFNPSLGGIGKGHLVREIDALDGVCGRMCDKSAIHYKMLNRSKNPALWGPRAHVDRTLYKKMVREHLMSCKNLELRSGVVEDLIVSREKHLSEMGLPLCQGVILDGSLATSKAVVLCPGTFLESLVHVGLERKDWGRESNAALTDSFKRHGFKLGKLKIGVSARIQKKSIDINHMSTLHADESPVPFSFLRNSIALKPTDQVPSYITVTNAACEKFLTDNVNIFWAAGAQHADNLVCSSSLEAKFLKFPGQQQQLWLEPEGLFCNTMYAEGFSCKLSESQQGDMLRKIPSFRSVIIEEPAYEIEYNFIMPHQLKPSLEATQINNLFLAGHIIGTAGYEEAAALGIIAGINAACKVQKKEAFILGPEDSYTGVLINDIVNSDVITEPYKMCTIRSNNFMLLRPDNADLRLTEKASVTNCISERRLSQVQELKQQLMAAKELLLSDIRPVSEWSLLLDHMPSKNNSLKNGLQIFCLPTTNVENFVQVNPDRYLRLLEGGSDFLARLKMEGMFHIIIEEQEKQMEELKRAQSLEIPDDIDYDNASLKIPAEVRVKFTLKKPATIGAASRIDGVTSADLHALLRFVKYQEVLKKKPQKHLRKRST